MARLSGDASETRGGGSAAQLSGRLLGSSLEAGRLHRQVPSFIRRVSRPNSGPRTPAKLSDSVARDPLPTGSTACLAVTTIPGARLTQVKLVAPTSVTVQRAGGNFGCRTHARPPGRSGPWSVRRTLVIDAVHSCHFSISLITAQTRSGGAAMSTPMLKSTAPHVSPRRRPIAVGVVRAARSGRRRRGRRARESATR